MRERFNQWWRDRACRQGRHVWFGWASYSTFDGFSSVMERGFIRGCCNCKEIQYMDVTWEQWERPAVEPEPTEPWQP